MWGVVAAFFKDRPEIIGIELINEPFAGDLYRDPLIMVPVRSVRMRMRQANSSESTLAYL
jgi:endoglycosylceramidase